MVPVGGKEIEVDRSGNNHQVSRVKARAKQGAGETSIVAKVVERVVLVATVALATAAAAIPRSVLQTVALVVQEKETGIVEDEAGVVVSVPPTVAMVLAIAATTTKTTETMAVLVVIEMLINPHWVFRDQVESRRL